MRTLFFLLSVLLGANLLTAQAVATGDSLALVAIYNSLGGDQTDLNWLDGPIDTWGDENEIVFSQTEEETLRVSQLNLTNKNLTGVVPEELNDLDFLSRLGLNNNQIEDLPNVLNLPRLEVLWLGNNRLTEMANLNLLTNLIWINCSSNELIQLPDLSNLSNLQILQCSDNLLIKFPSLSNPTSLKELNCSNNYLDTLPDLSSLVFLQTFDCSNNKLNFDDIIPMLNSVSGGEGGNITYTPQRPLSNFDYHMTPRQDFLWKFYQEQGDLSSYTFEWFKDGILLDNTQDYFFDTLDLSEAGSYALQVSNTDAPELTIEYPIELYVYLSNEVPFDTTSLIVISSDTIGLKTCACQNDSPGFSLMEGITDMIELNNNRTGSNSNVDKDTTEFNFHLQLDPIVPPVAPLITCDQGASSIIQGLPPSEAAVKVAVIGTGIEKHDSLVNHFYRISEPLSDDRVSCIDTGQVAYDYVFDSTGPKGLEHETHVAGIITKDIPSGTDLDLIDIKIYEDGGSLYNLICAINFAREAGAEVINLSLGYPDFGESPSLALYNVLKKTQEDSIIVVISSGNDSTKTTVHKRWPGNFIEDTFYEASGDTLKALDNLFVVAALNHSEDAVATYSNYGQLVHIAAPGTNIRSTVIIDDVSDYKELTGTSMTAGFASRAAAILKASYPTLSPAQVIDTLIAYGDSIIVGNRPIASNKKINLQAAIDALNLTENEPGVAMALVDSLPINEGKPNRIRHSRQILGDDLIFSLDRGNELYRDVRFEVVNSGVVVAEGYCPLASRMIWNGMQLDGTMISRKNYYLRFWVQEQPVSINPPNILFK